MALQGENPFGCSLRDKGYINILADKVSRIRKNSVTKTSLINLMSVIDKFLLYML